MNDTSEESVDQQLRASSAALRSSVGAEAQIDGAWQRHQAATFGPRHRARASRPTRRRFMALGSVALAAVVIVTVVAVRQSPEQTITSPPDLSGLPTDELADGLTPSLCDDLHEALNAREHSMNLMSSVADVVEMFWRLGESARLAGAAAFSAAADGTAEALNALDQLSTDSRANDTSTTTVDTDNWSAAQRPLLLQRYYLAALSLACYDAGYPVGTLRIMGSADSTEESTP